MPQIFKQSNDFSTDRFSPTAPTKPRHLSTFWIHLKALSDNCLQLTHAIHYRDCLSAFVTHTYTLAQMMETPDKEHQRKISDRQRLRLACPSTGSKTLRRHLHVTWFSWLAWHGWENKKGEKCDHLVVAHMPPSVFYWTPAAPPKNCLLKITRLLHLNCCELLEQALSVKYRSCVAGLANSMQPEAIKQLK